MRFVAIQFNRTADEDDRHFLIANLMSNHTQKMKCIRAIRLQMKNLPVNLFGCLPPTGLMMLDRHRELFRGGGHRGSRLFHTSFIDFMRRNMISFIRTVITD